MNTYCGANCGSCSYKGECRGCLSTGGSPFGGSCIAAEYVKSSGLAAYRRFKEQLTSEINALLAAADLPPVTGLCELAGAYVDLEYTLPGGRKARFLDPRNVYLGAQVELPTPGLCLGVVADAAFVLICSYRENGAEPELILYKKR